MILNSGKYGNILICYNKNKSHNEKMKRILGNDYEQIISMISNKYKEGINILEKRNELEELKIKIKEDIIKYNKLSEINIELNKKNENKETEIYKLNEQIKEIKVEKESLNGQIKQIKGEKESLNEEIKQIKEEKEFVNGQIKQIKEEKESLNGQIKQIKEEKKSLNVQIKDMNNIIGEKNERISELK